MSEGQSIRLTTQWGSAEGIAHLNPLQHPTLAWVAWGWTIDAGELVGGPVDPQSGSAQLVGEPCRVEAL